MSSAAHISDSQLNANRQNARKSTGPRTDEAKNRTRLNGLSHGLTGQTIVMPHEDHAKYEAFCAETIASLEPGTDAEHTLAQTIANESWRLNRARAIEENTFALGLTTANINNEVDAALNQAMTYLDHAREIQLLSLYAGRIARSIQKNKNELQTLQSERKAAHARELEEALLLAQLAKSKGQIYNPASDGFGFSTSELTRIIDRRHRLEQAQNLFQPQIQPRRAA